MSGRCESSQGARPGGRESGRRAGGGAAPARAAGGEGAGRRPERLGLGPAGLLLPSPGLGARPPCPSCSPQKKLPESNSSARSEGQWCARLYPFPLSPFSSLSLPSLGSVRAGGLHLPAVRRPPGPAVSPPPAPVTWAGSPLPRPRATSPCTLPALGPGEWGGALPHCSHLPGGREGWREVCRSRGRSQASACLLRASWEPVSGRFSAGASEAFA